MVYALNLPEIVLPAVVGPQAAPPPPENTPTSFWIHGRAKISCSYKTRQLHKVGPDTQVCDGDLHVRTAPKLQNFARLQCQIKTSPASPKAQKGCDAEPLLVQWRCPSRGRTFVRGSIFTLGPPCPRCHTLFFRARCFVFSGCRTRLVVENFCSAFVENCTGLRKFCRVATQSA